MHHTTPRGAAGRGRAPAVLACDPGGAESGIVVRAGSRLLEHALVRLENHDSWCAYVNDVVATVIELDHEWAAEMVACEDVVPPNPHVGRRRNARDGEGLNLTNVQGILRTARVIGALEHAIPDVVLVRPGGHGKVPEDLPRGRHLDAWMRNEYPAELLPDKDGAAYTDRLRHCRAAWDLAKAAVKQTRNVQMRFAGAT